MSMTLAGPLPPNLSALTSAQMGDAEGGGGDGEMNQIIIRRLIMAVCFTEKQFHPADSLLSR